MALYSIQRWQILVDRAVYTAFHAVQFGSVSYKASHPSVLPLCVRAVVGMSRSLLCGGTANE